MAQAFWEQLGGEARSAGSAPAARVHPEVVAAMRELGIDLSARTPRGLTDDDAKPLIYFNRGGICWDPKVKDLTVTDNSIYNGWRMEDIWLDR